MCALFVGIQSVGCGVVIVVVAARKYVVEIVLSTHWWIPRLAYARHQGCDCASVLGVHPLVGKAVAVVEGSVSAGNRNHKWQFVAIAA